MHCVSCGVFLQENAVGIICQKCKNAAAIKADHSKENYRLRHIITIKYCYICGEPYEPTDMSIKHFICQLGKYREIPKSTTAVMTV